MKVSNMKRRIGKISRNKREDQSGFPEKNLDDETAGGGDSCIY
jgi:hypothetical protein